MSTSRISHSGAVSQLVETLRGLPVDAPLRLRKRTSNLFRTRVSTSRSLDVAAFAGVLAVDPVARTAEVQGMCTYEDLVDSTLAYGLIPLVVPQLKTITLGGAVAGLGIESTSFRNGLPHESVLEMDVLTGSGEIVTCSPTGEHADLFRAFPNSYGSLGYALRLVIEVEPVREFVALHHLPFSHVADFSSAVQEISSTGAYDGQQVDALDGVAFAPDDLRLTLATWTDDPGPVSDYTGQSIYYRSIQERRTDRLRTRDYLWRWDTDWFWCSGAFGAQRPLVRRLWPRRYRRSDVYHRLVGLDQRFGIADRLDRRAGRPQRERVVQDIEVPLDRIGEFLDWFDDEVGMRPVWLCPLRLRDNGHGKRPWSSYPLQAGITYINAGFWGTVHVGPQAPSAPVNRAIEVRVDELGGHKSLYSEAFYSPETFAELYDEANLVALAQRYDPNGRLTALYDKVVRRQ